MTRVSLKLLLVLPVLAAVGCSSWPGAGPDAKEGEPKVEIDQVDAVTSGGNRQAVLSLHERYAYEDACKFGLTLTNNLPYPITNISFRFVAHVGDGVSLPPVKRNFFEVEPSQGQHREITFPGIRCEEIKFVEISDLGRCVLGDLKGRSSRPGDCIRRVHIAETPYVSFVQQ